MRDTFLSRPPDLKKPVAETMPSLTWRENNVDESSAITVTVNKEGYE